MKKLYFRYGAMGSSKTANALMTKFNYEERGKHVLLLHPAIDTREPGFVSSRIGLKSESFKMPNDMHELLCMVYGFEGEKKKMCSCIIVDEAQFLSNIQVEMLRTITFSMDIPVICYGLRTDFQGHLFPGSMALMALADSIEEIKTICFCGKKATMNMRLDEKGNVVRHGEQIQIGGNESYVAVCYEHWLIGKHKEN